MGGGATRVSENCIFYNFFVCLSTFLKEKKKIYRVSKHEYAPSHHYHQDQEEQPSQHCLHRRRKGPARKEKDHIRARNHQQARIIQPAASESFNSDQNEAASADIIYLLTVNFF